MEWRPIETAPKDGRVILGFSLEEDDDLMPQLIRWYQEGWVIAWDHTMMTGCKYFMLPNGKQCVTGHFQPPTHWMPLPDFPVAA